MDVLGIVEVLRGILHDFANGNFKPTSVSGLFLLSTACYMFIQVLRGKIVLPIPGVTKWIETLTKTAKTWLILGTFAVVGGLTSFNGEIISFWTVLDGLVGGLLVGATTIGLRSGVKEGMGGVGRLRESMRRGVVDGELDSEKEPAEEPDEG